MALGLPPNISEQQQEIPEEGTIKKRRSLSNQDNNNNPLPISVSNTLPKNKCISTVKEQSKSKKKGFLRSFHSSSKDLLFDSSNTYSPSRDKKSKKNTHSEAQISSDRILPLLKELERGDDICFDFNPLDPEMPSVRYATLRKVIERLTLPTLAQDMYFRNVFFLTYPSFSTSEEVFNLFKDRLEEGKQLQSDLSMQIVLRIVASFRAWIETYPDEFIIGKPLRKKVEDLANNNITISEASSVLLSALPVSEGEEVVITRTRALRTESPAIAIDDFSVLQPGRICFIELNPLEVARQLTTMAATIFSKLKPQEFSNKNWCGDEKHILSPNIMKIVSQFNKISQWVMTEILQPFQVKARAKILEKVIQVIRYFREFNNFHGLMAILSGLQSSPVKRLQQTWANVSENDRVFIKEMNELMSFKSSYKCYRETLQSIHEAERVLPFIGIFLTDLVYIEDGNPSYLAPGKINFVKFKLIASIINQLRAHRTNYTFIEIPAIFQWFNELEVINEEEAYLLSTKVEPRDTSEALETLLFAEANLRKSLEDIKVQNDLLMMKEKEHAKTIELLSTQLREQRKILTIANAKDKTLLRRYSANSKDAPDILKLRKSKERSIKNLGNSDNGNIDDTTE